VRRDAAIGDEGDVIERFLLGFDAITAGGQFGFDLVESEGVSEGHGAGGHAGRHDLSP